MPTIYLIRHGQGSFGTHNYDRLSPVGQRQARLLGAHLHALGVPFAAAYSGTLQRQRNTGALALERMSAEGLTLHEDDAFNEYDANAIIAAYLPRVLASPREVAQDLRRSIFADNKLFQNAFSRVLEAWLNEEPHDHPALEPWSAFRDRLMSAIARLGEAHERGDSVLVFTSGGVIATALAHALGLNATHTMRVNWTVHNASITRLHLGRSGPRLLGFNNVDYLQVMDDPSLITFR